MRPNRNSPGYGISPSHHDALQYGIAKFLALAAGVPVLLVTGSVPAALIVGGVVFFVIMLFG